MTDFTTIMKGSEKVMTEEEQKKVGQSTAAKMDTEHENFLKTVLKLIDSKEIDPGKPQSLLRQSVYDALDAKWKAKVDIALVNIANLLEHIVGFRLSTHTPNESPELQNMIEQLWQMKQRIEEFHDVFKF